ncbi:FecR family protein [uncultured Muribaculum sp.]|uniref:FecR family protein n=1 Tax=uncultured Muribaculum sp. TaxID=1918613 RepID=UPI0025F775E7|nr:FecR family protein [uncultured Muribaculum sp.]
MKNYIHEVISRYVRHDYTGDFDRDFRSWLIADEHADEKDRELSSLWTSVDGLSTPGFSQSLDRMRRLTGIGARTGMRRMRRRMAWMSMAAAIMLAVSTISVYMLLGEKRSDNLLQAYIPKAETSDITLPDGSRVLVNAQSTLLYPSEFTGDTRCVYLIGEADFKVVPDADHPFIVKSADMQVTALGTEFNVAAYPEVEEVVTTLLSGKVLVEYDELRSSQVLHPNQQLVYNKRTRTSAVNFPDMNDVTAWQRGEIVFRSLTPDEIFTRLGRRFPYTFVYSPHSLKHDRFNLTFGPDASFEEVMSITALVMGDLDYRIEDDRCYLISRQ